MTFEIRTPRSLEQTATAMVQFLASFPTPPRGLLNVFKQAPTITLEFLSQGQTIYTLLTVPDSLESYITTQLAASYPEVLISKLEHNPLQEFNKAGVLCAGKLNYANNSAYSLNTFRSSETQDLLAGPLSALSKLKENEEALIQISLRKDRETWKPSTNANPDTTKVVSTPKLAQASLQFSLALLVQAPTKAESQHLLNSLATTFTPFRSADNSLHLQRSIFRPNALVQEIMERRPRWRKQFVSLDEAATLFHLPNKALSNVKNIAWGKNLLGEPPANLPTFSNIPEAERNDVNFFGTAEYKNQQQIFGIKREDRRRHMYVMGKSGTGKSTLLANMIIHDLKHGEGVAVIDPHGDLIETVLDYVPKSRINDVIVFDPSDPEAVVKMNLFEGGSLVHRELIASGIVAIFQKLYSTSWGPRLEYILRNTLLTLLSTNAKLEDVLKMLTDPKFRGNVVANLDDEVLKSFWIGEYEAMTDKQRMESISSILNKVGQFVTSPLVRKVVNSTKSTFDIESVMDEGKILLVNVSQGKLGEDNAALLGAMMITKIQLAAMNRVYKPESERRDFYLYIDEFQNFATTSFIKILSEARKYHLNLILANQYMDQITDDVKAAIFGNAGSMVSFILGAKDAEYLKREFGNKYTEDDLVSLGRYQIITKLMIDNQASMPFPAHTLGLANSSNQNRDKVIKVSRERYAKAT